LQLKNVSCKYGIINPCIKITFGNGASKCRGTLLLILLIVLGVLVSLVGVYVGKRFVDRPLWRRRNIRPVVVSVVVTGIAWLLLTVPASRVAKTTWWFGSDCGVSKTTTCEYSKVATGVALGIGALAVIALGEAMYHRRVRALSNITTGHAAMLLLALALLIFMTVSAVFKKKWFVWQRSCP
jgi:hypothetical protein